MESVNSSQDGRCVVYIIWNKVIVAKICYGIAMSRISIFVYVDVIFSKCWSVPSVVINSSLWIFHHALEGCKLFFIIQRKDERLGSGAKPLMTLMSAIGL